jgi:hypothetical protein
MASAMPWMRGRPVFDAPNEGGAGAGDDDAAKAAAEKAAAEKEAAAKAEAEKAAKEKADKEAADKAAAEAAAKAAEEEAEKKKGGKLSDSERELLHESMERKKQLREAKAELAKANERLKAFEGVDPAELKKLVQAQKDAEKKAEEAKIAEAEKRGEFDRVKKAMADAHKAELEKKDGELTSTKSQLDKALGTIDELTVGAAFSNSQYVRENTVLTPSIARNTFGTHVDRVNGQLVVYDKPRGAADRTPLVDSAGSNLGFDAGIQVLVEKHPDRDSLVRSKLRDGAQSRTTTVRGQETRKTVENDGPRGVNRIAASLANGAFKKAAKK